MVATDARACYATTIPQGLTFRQGGQELYSASGDATVKVWSTAQMSYVETLFGHQVRCCPSPLLESSVDLFDAC
jgi:hypothetical protein